ncbi:MAG TPA: C13 family peptidase [Thermoanaerobaculia bacterium]|nr:C13 family peptidase [Thermoanaerobaculia bacterium]
MIRALAAGLLGLVGLLAAAAATAADTHLLAIAGLGGEPQYQEAFHQQAIALADAALAAGVPAERVTVLTEDPSRAEGRVAARSTRENVQSALADLAERSRPGDEVWIVLLGHGSASGHVSRVNLPGPDLTDGDYAAALVPLADRKVVFVIAASSSGGFLTSLAGPDRVVITATRSAGERNETIFGRLFVEALASERSDADRDGRVSVLEAFLAANREVERHYETEKLLRTEHALLDDNGDGEGSQTPEPLGGEDGGADGMLAARLHLAGGAGPAVPEELRGLAERRAELADQLDELRRQKATLSEEVYTRELQRLLLEIAQIDTRLRAAAEPGAETGAEPGDGGAR